MAKGAKEIDIAATLEHLRDQRPRMVISIVRLFETPSFTKLYLLGGNKATVRICSHCSGRGSACDSEGVTSATFSSTTATTRKIIPTNQPHRKIGEKVKVLLFTDFPFLKRLRQQFKG